MTNKTVTTNLPLSPVKGVVVALFAMCLELIGSRKILAAHCVLVIRHRLYVNRINAGWVSAKVVAVQLAWNQFVKELIHEAVGEPRNAVKSATPVTIGVFVCRPLPAWDAFVKAGLRDFYLRKEPDEDVAGDRDFGKLSTTHRFSPFQKICVRLGRWYQHLSSRINVNPSKGYYEPAGAFCP